MISTPRYPSAALFPGPTIFPYGPYTPAQRQAARVAAGFELARPELGNGILFTLSLAGARGAYQSSVSALSPSLFLGLNETSGTVAIDQSSNGRNGTYVGGVTLNQPGILADGSPAVLLDGVNGKVTTTYNPFAQSSMFSAAGWAYRRTSTSNDVIFGSDAGSNVVACRINSGIGDIQFFATTAGGAVTWTAAAPLATWFHWALVYNDSTRAASLYINGVLISTQTLNNPFNASPGNFLVGARLSSGSDPFDGYQSAIAAWAGVALGAAQVLTLYQSNGPPLISGVFSYGPKLYSYDLEEAALDGGVLTKDWDLAVPLRRTGLFTETQL